MRNIFINALLMVVSILPISAQDISISLKDATLETFVKCVQQQTNYTFIYGQDVEFDYAVNIEVKNAPLERILADILTPQHISFKISKLHISLVKNASQGNPPGKENKPMHTISGYIKDASSRETLIGATAYSIDNHKGMVTNAYGFFSLTLPEGVNHIHFSYIGYESQTHSINFKEDVEMIVNLVSDNKLEEITIEADRPETGIASSRTGATTMPVDRIKSQPALLGEADVLKSLQILPGVQQGIGGMSNIYVHGGSPDQNLYMLDGVPMYNIDHMLGFVSAFSSDVTKNVDFFKASFPARYGGRLSSVIDVRTKDGNMQNWHTEAQIGILSAHLTVEGPLVKDKTSILISGRQSLIHLADPLINNITGTALGTRFTDINVKVNHIFTNKDRIFASFYLGRDRQHSSDDYIKNIMDAKWGNTLGAFRWNHVFSPKLFSNTTLSFNHFYSNEASAYGNYSYNYGQPLVKSDVEIVQKSKIDDISATIDFDYHPIPHHHIQFGGQYTNHTYSPQIREMETLVSLNDSVTRDYSIKDNGETHCNEVSLYAEDDFSIKKLVQMNIGIRAVLFATDNRTYCNVEPRLSSAINIASGLKTKASYTMMHQYVQLLQTNRLAMPSDIWLPISEKFKPMISNQFSVGIYYSGVKFWEFSAEAYYRDMRNILDFRDNTIYNGNTAKWENLVSAGKGYSEGIEFFARKTEGRTTGSVSYTLAKTNRKFDKSINNGHWFPYRYDRRHTANITISHQITKDIDIVASWFYASGIWETISRQITSYATPVENSNEYLFEQNYGYCDRRNNYRLDPSHRLDICANFHKKLKHASRILSIGLVNAYCHKNPDYAFNKYERWYEDDELNSQLVLCQQSLIPILPSITYTIKF